MWYVKLYYHRLALFFWIGQNISAWVLLMSQVVRGNGVA